jgi:putative transposase
MSHSHVSLHYHLVFSTKDRLPHITSNLSQRLYDFIGGIIRAEGGVLHAAGGEVDHLHLSAGFRQDTAVSDMVRKIKANSSRWVHDTFPLSSVFAWQEGYGAFSLSFAGLDKVKEYISHQQEHHRTVTFQEEYLSFLERHQIPYDPRYVWK